MRLAYEVLEDWIYKLFQGCIELGYHPKVFKVARTVTLRKPKKESYYKAKSYCPIALLDTLGKALEKIVARQLAGLAEEHHMLLDQQIGARQQRDTTTVLELFTEQIYTV